MIKYDFQIFYDASVDDFRMKRLPFNDLPEKLLSFRASLRIIKLMYRKFEPKRSECIISFNALVDFQHWLIKHSFYGSFCPALIDSIDFDFDGTLVFHFANMTDGLKHFQDLTYPSNDLPF